eukprot:TRINITY_DN6705_c0_g2_i1.p1 TRINITY_DN6705_c0_g2~~TRINITY_DN6705_c0_g2_i1.p1  ORF type:complete len:326 (+),score=155.42 TRINITY_DN6705_c0_g2_i1:87-1064(+)
MSALMQPVPQQQAPPPQQQQQQQQPPPPQQQQQQQQQQQNGKKQYINDIGDPSRVVHCRNVTPDVTQSGLVALCMQFGRVVNTVMLRAKNQALIEMEDDAAAQKVVEHCQSHGYVEVDHRRVYVKYSRHTELSDIPAGKTLLVSMYNPDCDISTMIHITPVVVYQIFGNWGEVEKIVVLAKNASSQQNHNRVQALVQFASQDVAQNVKDVLQGQPVNLGEAASFFLDIQFSKVQEITTNTNAANSNAMTFPKGMTPSLLMMQNQMGWMSQMGGLSLGGMGNMGAAGVGGLGNVNMNAMNMGGANGGGSAGLNMSAAPFMPFGQNM